MDAMDEQGDVALGVGEDGDGVPPLTLKFLIASSAAGSVIGKGGSTINEFQTQTGARIQLSRNQEVFPGTTDRLVILSGTASAILGALHLMIKKLIADGEGMAGGALPQVKLVVPNSSCGCIIGKGGATIRTFVEDSQAEIKLSPQDRMPPGVADRILTITGTIEQVLRAVALVATALSEDEGYAALAARSSTYSSHAMASVQAGMAGIPRDPAAMAMMAAQGVPMMMPGVGASMPGMPGMLMAQGAASTQVVVAVPDEHIGAVLGKGGRTISEIQVVSGVRIKVSDRNDFVQGTRNRKVTLTGTPEAVQMAQYLLSQKLQTSVQTANTR